jgi:hypothetical protein
MTRKATKRKPIRAQNDFSYHGAISAVAHSHAHQLLNPPNPRALKAHPALSLIALYRDQWVSIVPVIYLYRGAMMGD